MKILKIDEQNDFVNNKINLSMLFKSPEEKLSLSYYNSKDKKEKDCYEKLYDFFSKSEIDDIVYFLDNLQRSFKNSANFNNDISEFFEDEIIRGQEDKMALLINVQRGSAIEIRTSDFGIAIAYARNDLEPDNISVLDKEDIISAITILNLLIEDPEAAKTYKEKIIMKSEINAVTKKDIRKKF